MAVVMMSDDNGALHIRMEGKELYAEFGGAAYTLKLTSLPRRKGDYFSTRVEGEPVVFHFEMRGEMPGPCGVNYISLYVDPDLRLANGSLHPTYGSSACQSKVWSQDRIILEDKVAALFRQITGPATVHDQ